MAVHATSTPAPTFQRGLLPNEIDLLAEFEADFAALIAHPWPEEGATRHTPSPEEETVTVAPLRPEVPPEPLLSAKAPGVCATVARTSAEAPKSGG